MIFTIIEYNLIEILIKFCLLFNIIIAVNPSPDLFSLPQNTELLTRNGRREYESLMEKRNLPIYGQCWERVIIDLESSCMKLNENRQSWLAIAFTNCFLKASGTELTSSSCKKAIDFARNDFEIPSSSLEFLTKDCVKTLIDSNLFNTYTLFFVHTQSICFYLQSERWQKNTENLVNSLVRDAKIVSNDLNSAVLQINQLESLQNSSLEVQKSINEELNQAKINLDKFQQQTKAQQDLVEKIINQFSILQDYLVSEFHSSHTILFYTFLVLIIYFMTSNQRTIEIRSMLYFLMIVFLFIERNGFQYLIRLDSFIDLAQYDTQYLFSAYNATIDSSNKTWLLRKLLLTIQSIIYVYRLITFTDQAEINCRLLRKNSMILEDINRRLRKFDKIPQSKFFAISIRFIFE